MRIMEPSNSVLDLFFHDLKKYNGTNFSKFTKFDLSDVTPAVYKSYSSVITRYFIFLEKHPEITPVEANILYFQARIDMVARFFSEYPVSNAEDLKPFQDEVKRYIDRTKQSDLNVAEAKDKVDEQVPAI